MELQLPETGLCVEIRRWLSQPGVLVYAIILALGWQKREDLEFRVSVMLYQSGHPNLRNRKGGNAELTGKLSFAFPEITV